MEDRLTMDELTEELTQTGVSYVPIELKEDLVMRVKSFF